MIAGIITTPDRQQYLPGLIKTITPKVRELRVFNDLGKQGHEWNLKRCLRSVLAEAGPDEPALILSDDAETVPDWYERFEGLKKRMDNKPAIYVFFTRQRHLLKYADRGYFYGVQPNGFYDPAFILIGMNDLVDRVDEWFTQVGQFKINKKRQAHYDIIIQEYLTHQGIPWVITVPTLFEHIGEKSTLGHSIGKSISYIGNLIR